MLTRILMIGACLLAPPFAALAQPVFHYLNEDTVWTRDRATGQTVLVPLEESIGLTNDLALTPSGDLVAWEFQTHRLLSIDVETGAVENLGVFDVSDGFPPENVQGRGLAVDACGRIFLAAGLRPDSEELDRLWQLDPESGLAHKLGEFERWIGSMAAIGEEIIAIGTHQGRGGILHIDPFTMETETIPSEPTGVTFYYRSDLDENGLLWMSPPPPFSPSPPTQPLLSIDIETGEVMEHELTYGKHFAIAPAGGTCLSGAPLVIPMVSPSGLVGLAVLLMLAGVWVSVRRRKEV